MLKVLIPFLF